MLTKYASKINFFSPNHLPENKKGEKETYIGLASNLKSRFHKHWQSMEVQTSENLANLSHTLHPTRMLTTHSHLLEGVRSISLIIQNPLHNMLDHFKPTKNLWKNFREKSIIFREGGEEGGPNIILCRKIAISPQPNIQLT